MEKVKEFFRVTNDELFNKVSWPTWEELQSSTIVVMVGMLVIAAIIYLLDVVSGGSMGLFYQIFK